MIPPFRVDLLRVPPAETCRHIERRIRELTFERLRRRGAVLGISGGIDSSVAAALCARALGRERMLGLLLPEVDSSPESLRLGRLLADSLGIPTVLEDVGPILRAAGCYERRDQAIRGVLPEYGAGWTCKLSMTNVRERGGYPIYHVVARTPEGQEKTARLDLNAFLGVVAATSFKQRTRKMLEYYHADRLRYAVIGTPNRLEYDQGFFVKNGDGSADVKPIAHLYKTQVYQLADHLAIPEEIRRRLPTTDTYPLHQSQDEFFFLLPHREMDLCLYGKNHKYPAEEVAAATGLTAEQVQRAYDDIDAKRRAAEYLHASPLLVDMVSEARRSDAVA